MLLDASTLTPKGFTSLRRLCASPVANKLFSRAIMMSLVLASCFGVFHMPSYRRVMLNHKSRDANEVPWRVEKSSVAVVWWISLQKCPFRPGILHYHSRAGWTQLVAVVGGEPHVCFGPQGFRKREE